MSRAELDALAGSNQASLDIAARGVGQANLAGNNFVATRWSTAPLGAQFESGRGTSRPGRD